MADNFKTINQEFLDRYNRAKNRSGMYRHEHEAIRKYLRPNTLGFYEAMSSHKTQGDRRTEQITDSTALWALDTLASGLYAHILDPSDRWFSLGVKGVPFTQLSFEMQAYLEDASEKIFTVFADPRSRFAQASKEMLLDLCAYGTGVMLNEWDSDMKLPYFRAYPLSAVHIDEDHRGMVNVVARDFPMTKAQIEGQFPDAVFTDSIEKENEDFSYIVTHLVDPIEAHTEKVDTKKDFVSTYFIESENLVLRQKGYDRFPYKVPRWSTLAGEVYGRGPGNIAMPDIRLLNVMYRELVQSAQLANRPPMFVDDDGYLLPISYVPAAINFKTPGTTAPETLRMGSSFNITLEVMNQKRDQIAKTFHVDWLLRNRKRERQSILEIQDDRTEMLRQLSSVVGRFESECASPLIEDTYFHLDRAGLLPEPPVEGVPLEVAFTSPAAKAQLSSKAANIMQFLNDVSAYRAIDPSITDGIDTASLGQELATLREAPKRILKSQEQIQQTKQERDQIAAQTANAQNAAALAGALKDTAAAQAQGLGRI